MLRTKYTTKKIPGKCVTLTMTATRKMVVDLTDKQLNDAVKRVGGLVNYQVKYLGKPTKSYVIPHSSIPNEVLRQWKQCKDFFHTMYVNKCAFCVDEGTEVDDTSSPVSSSSSEPTDTSVIAQNMAASSASFQVDDSQSLPIINDEFTSCSEVSSEYTTGSAPEQLTSLVDCSGSLNLSTFQLAQLNSSTPMFSPSPTPSADDDDDVLYAKFVQGCCKLYNRHKFRFVKDKGTYIT